MIDRVIPSLANLRLRLAGAVAFKGMSGCGKPVASTRQETGTT
jgi:hypothetical protein